MEPFYYNKNEDDNFNGIYGEDFDEDIMYDIDFISSANDCTGLIPTLPIDEEESDSYTKLYDIPKPKSENFEDSTQNIDFKEK